MMGIILQKHLKVSSRSNIRNLVKAVRIIHNYVLDTHTLTDIALYNIDWSQIPEVIEIIRNVYK